MESSTEMKSFVHVWVSVIASFCYCYFVSASIPKGLLRFLSLLPVIFLLAILPLRFSSIHLSAATSYYLTWLATFKLLLFSLGQGPLSPPQPLLHFICTAALPIETSQNRDPSTPKIISPFSKNNQKILFFLKVMAFAALLEIYNYREFLHPTIILALYSGHVYLLSEVIMAVVTAPARAIGLELEPRFNEPYLSTSLQDFWGRRWNLVSSSILRTTVYQPVRSFTTRTFGPRWALQVGMVAAFTVSGIMHEVLYYHMTRVKPTWQVTWFFVLHGVCTAAEVTVKKAVGRGRQLPWLLTIAATLAFVLVTSSWLFLWQPMRDHVDEKAIEEYSVFMDALRKKMLLPPIFFHFPNNMEVVKG